MSTYKWKKDSIDNSSLNEYTKSILKNEMNSVKDNTSSLTCYDASNYNEFKNTYIKEYNAVKRLYPELVDYIDSLDTSILKKIKNIRLSYNTNRNTSDLLYAMEELVLGLEDRDLINEYANIVNSNKNYLNIEPTTLENMSIRDYVGRCISEDSSKDTYISLYTNDDLTDFTNLAHEFGHAFEHRLFFEERNPILKNFLTEVSSLYFELLMMDEVNKYLNVSEAKDYLMSNKLLYINRNILVNQMSLFILFQNKFDLSSLKEFYSEKIGPNFTIDTENGFYLSSYIDTINYIASYMIALTLYKKTKFNKYDGLDTYKMFVSDTTTSLTDLLDRYDLNFMKNGLYYDEVQLKSELAYKKLIKK